MKEKREIKDRNRISLAVAETVLKELEFKRSKSDEIVVFIDEERGSLIIKPKNEKVNSKTSKGEKQIS